METKTTPTEAKTTNMEASSRWTISSLITFLTLLAIVAGLFWNIGRKGFEDQIDALKSEIESYKQAKKLPEAVNSINLASERLAEHLKTLNDYEKLQGNLEKIKLEKNELEGKYAMLVSENKILVDKNNESERVLRSFYTDNEDFSIQLGSSKSFFGGDLVVGYIDYNSKDIDVNINGKRYKMEVGSPVSISTQDKICAFHLLRYIYTDRSLVSSVPLSFRCKKKDAQEK